MSETFRRMTPHQRWALAKRAERIHATPLTGLQRDLPCPLCGRRMRLRESFFGRYYRCSQKGCKGKVGARADGTPTKGPGFKPKTALERIVGDSDL